MQLKFYLRLKIKKSYFFEIFLDIYKFTFLYMFKIYVLCILCLKLKRTKKETGRRKLCSIEIK